MPPALAKQKLKAAEMVARQKGKIMVLRWRDKKAVCLLSTVHNTATTIVKKGSKGLRLCDYNFRMGGVDRTDQAITFYLTIRK